MQIIEDKKNPLLGRREVKLIIEAEKNPSMEEAAKIVGEQFKSVEENIAVKQVKGKFGRNTFLITANIYKSKENKEKIEPKLKGKKGKEKKPEEKKEKPEEKVPEGEPKEGIKEEAKE